MIVLNGGHRGRAGFRLDQPIGQGGMGVVWLGRQMDTDLPVAVKVLTGERARVPEAVAAFQREVAAVAALAHPGIVMVFAYGQVDAQAARASEGQLVEGSPFLVMEHAAEGTLAERCGRMTWPELRSALLSLLDALAHAHACDLIHRDIKPANVLVGGVRPGLKLSDFGLAYGGAGDVLQGGTPQFMAPEQARGRTHEFGPWTDLYALGALGWSIASGAPPFPRPSLAAQGPPPLAPRVRMAVPRGLEGWLRRLLHHDPYQRYSRAADAAMALLELDDGDLIAASPPSPQESPRFHTLVNLGASTGEVDTAIPHPLVQPGDTREGPWWQDGEERVEIQPLPAVGPPPMPASWRRPAPLRPDSRLVRAGLGLYGLHEIALVGRDPERDALWEEARAVHAERRSRVVLLVGEAGTGRSRLARWLCQTVHELGACSVLRAVHSDPPDARDGLVPMVERFFDARGMSRPQVAEQLRRRLGVEDASEIGAFTEFIRPLRSGEDARGVAIIKLNTETQRVEALARLLSVVSRARPVVVWLDSAQWGADALELAQTLCGTDHPILLVLTVRADIAASTVQVGDALEALGAGGARLLVVEPLDANDRRSLVRRLIGREAGDLDGACKALGKLGELAHVRGDFDVAERLLTEALDIARTHGLGEITNTGFLRLVGLLRDRGRPKDAWLAAQEGLRLARETEDRSGQHMALGLLGDLAERAGDFRMAQRYFDEAEAAVGEDFDPNTTLITLARLAHLDAKRHRFARAGDRLERCRAGFRRLGIRRNEGLSLLHLADALIGMGDSARAREVAGEAAKLFGGIGARMGETEALGTFANACAHQGDLLGARKHAGDAVKRARGLGRVVEQNLILLGSVRLASGHLQDARHALDEALAIPALQPDLRQRIEVQLAVLARLAGDATEAERRLRAIVSTAPSEPQPHLAEAAGELAALLLHQDDADGAGEWANRALEWTEELERRWDSEPRRDLRSLPLGVLAELAAREGRSVDAWDHYEASVAWWEADPLLTRALHHCRRGRIALHLGDRERAAAALAAAEQIALQAAVGPHSPLCQETETLRTRLHSSEA